MPVVFVVCLTFAPPLSAQDATSKDSPQLQQALKRYPEADADKDGVLTQKEARAYLQKSRQAGANVAKPAAAANSNIAAPEPTLADVHYGPHDRNVLDFWKAKSDRPAPVVVFIHGGGFKAGDKSKVRGDKLVGQCVQAGVSFAAINYRYRTNVPIQDVLRDCARAIQFIRSKAGEWNVDKSRIASYGGSAGAGTSLWLAFHDDLADPKSDDPVLRESSRLSCAGATSCQFSYDILAWDELLGEATKKYQADDDYAAFYGLKSLDDLRSPEGAKIRADCDMRGLITKDDPPVFLSTALPGGDITSRGALLHHPKHAKAVYDRCQEIGVPAAAMLPAFNLKPDPALGADMKAFLFKHLKVE